MKSKIINNIKKNYKLYKLLKKILWPIYSGYVFYMIRYYLFTRSFEVKLLKSLKITDIRIFNSKIWRIGKNADHVYRRYYVGFFDSQQCFIKIATNDSTTLNELKVYEKIKKYSFSFTPKIYIMKDNIKDDTVLIVSEYIDNLHPINEITDSKEANIVCNNFLLILNELEKIKLVHADINKGNLMLDANGNVKLLDFGISRFLDLSNDINYLYRPGTFYVNLNNERTYDDAFSFIELIGSLGIKPLFDNSSSYNEIINRIGKIKFTVDMNKYK